MEFVSRREPSGETAREVIVSECPVSVNETAPFAQVPRH